MDKLQTVDKYVARLLMLGFFLPMKLQAIAVMAPCVYFVIRTFCTSGPIQFRNLTWALVLGFGYLLYLFAIPITPAADKQMLMVLIGRRMSSIIVPVGFGIAIPRFGEVIVRELRFFVYGCLVACIAANAAFVYNYYFVTHALQPLSHVQYRLFFEAFIHIHPTYMGMYLVFSICIVLLRDIKVPSVLKYIMLYTLLLLLLALLAKSPLIALVLIFTHFAWMRRTMLAKHKWVLAGPVAVVVAAYFLIPFFKQRVNELSRFFDKDKHDSVADNSMYVRQLIWNVDTDLIKRHWLAGMGPGSMYRVLNERYFFYSMAHNFFTGYYDPHNEYFCQWISFGITGILVCVAVLIVHFVRAIKGRNYLYLYLLIVLAVTFATESVLSRQQGVLFYAVFTSLFFFYSPKKKDLP